MKNSLKLAGLPLFLLLLSCETENETSTLTVNTGKGEYTYLSYVDVTLTNQSDKDAAYFTCDNVDLTPSQILHYDNGEWVVEEIPVLCTGMGPAGYFGTIEADGNKKDTVVMDMPIGRVKLRYQFVIDNDTLNFDSNEFVVSDNQ